MLNITFKNLSKQRSVLHLKEEVIDDKFFFALANREDEYGFWCLIESKSIVNLKDDVELHGVLECGYQEKSEYETNWNSIHPEIPFDSNPLVTKIVFKRYPQLVKRELSLWEIITKKARKELEDQEDAKFIESINSID